MQKKPDIPCLNCGKLFHPNSKKAKFCCRECGIEYNKAHGKYAKTEEQKEKMSKARLGKEPWNKGRKCTDEELKRMSETSKEFWAKEGFREKMSEIQKESWSNKDLLKKHSQIMHDSISRPEVKQKIKEGLKAYYDNVDPQIITDRYKKQVQTRIEKGEIYTSSGELEMINYIKFLGFNPIKYVIGKGKTRFEIDCYIPELKIGIEFNGIYFHSTNGLNKRSERYHYNKSKEALEQGIDLIHIWEDQWKNQQEIIKDIIRVRLNIESKNKIYARKCIVSELTTEEYKNFCISNHIQGYRPAKIKLGLFYNGELIQVASFGVKNHTYNLKDNFDYEWIRSCTKLNTTVIGGISKLFNHFITRYNPNSILCYADWNLFNGKGYELLGFNFVDYTKANLFFVTNSSNLERKERNPYTNKEDNELVNSGKYYKCYGCGSKKFVWYKP
jgi:predicted  nucleic acid-binding Zn-ribbon protein